MALFRVGEDAVDESDERIFCEEEKGCDDNDARIGEDQWCCDVEVAGLREGYFEGYCDWLKEEGEAEEPYADDLTCFWIIRASITTDCWLLLPSFLTSGKAVLTADPDKGGESGLPTQNEDLNHKNVEKNGKNITRNFLFSFLEQLFFVYGKPKW